MTGPADQVELSELRAGVKAGSRRALAKAITLVESTLPEHRTAAERLLSAFVGAGGQSIRLGVSGPPGVGKSTFIEAYGMHLIAQGHKVAVLAIDPTSPVSGGSILGDRVRMPRLSGEEMAFIRPSPAGETSGGAARRTREAVLICEAAGFDHIIVETVGVGQSEVEAASMVDVFLVLSPPYAGDEIQAMKKGILELADIVAVTKADGETMAGASLAHEQLRLTLDTVTRPGGHTVKVTKVSAKTGHGLAELGQVVTDIADSHRKSGYLARKRRDQAVGWYQAELARVVMETLKGDPACQSVIASYNDQVRAGTLPGSVAADQAALSVLGPALGRKVFK